MRQSLMTWPWRGTEKPTKWEANDFEVKRICFLNIFVVQYWELVSYLKGTLENSLKVPESFYDKPSNYVMDHLFKKTKHVGLDYSVHGGQ